MGLPSRSRPRCVSLRYDREVTPREIVEADTTKIVQAFERLSAQSRYYRLMRNKKKLTRGADQQPARLGSQRQAPVLRGQRAEALCRRFVSGLGRRRALPGQLVQPAQRLFECLGPPLQRSDVRAIRAGGLLERLCLGANRTCLRATRAISLFRAEATLFMARLCRPWPAVSLDIVGFGVYACP